MFLHMFCILVR